MKDLILTIDEIAKFGLYPNFSPTDKEKLLEKNLVKIYSLYFEIEYKFDETDYPEFVENEYSEIRKNVTNNFPDFGLYKTRLDIKNINDSSDNGMGDAIDDLTDVILDLLEVKWRLEHNSLADGLWYFHLIFPSHTQQHILDLLNYLKQKNE